MTAKKDDAEKTDESTVSRPAESQQQEPVSDETVAVVEPTPVSTGAPSGLLEEAVVQVNKLAELREQEVRRQERLITQMQDVVSRHTRITRALLWIAGFTLLLVMVLAIGVVRMVSGQIDRSRQIDVATAEIRNTGSAIKRASGKIDSLQIGLTTKLDNTVDAMRRERDEVKAEVRAVLDDQNENLLTRELALKGEEARLVEETERVKQERLVIISDAINRLEAVAGELSVAESAPMMEITGAEEAPTPEPEPVSEPAPVESSIADDDAADLPETPLTSVDSKSTPAQETPGETTEAATPDAE